MNTASPADDWVTAADLLTALDESPSAPMPTNVRLICERAAVGLLRAKAARFLSDRETCEDCSLPTEFWQTTFLTDEPQGWKIGDLVSRSPQGGWWKAFGVSFNRADAEKMGLRFDRERSGLARSARRGGGPAKKAEWDEFWFLVLKWLNEGKLEEFSTQADLRRALLLAIDEKLSEPSIKPIVQRIWSEFRYKSRG